MITRILLAALFSTCLTLFGCSSGPEKPSDTEVKSVVADTLAKGTIPWGWLGGGANGTNAKISSVEILAWGTYNAERKFWPVKLRVVGTTLIAGTVPTNFDKEANFRFKQDDYKKWVFEIEGI